MTEAISSGEWVDILVSGVSDSMKQLAVYYSCSLSIFLCKFGCYFGALALATAMPQTSNLIG